MKLTDTFCTKKMFFTNFECSSFVANATKTLFAKFSINNNFLSKYPKTWNDDPGDESGLEKLQKTVVVMALEKEELNSSKNTITHSEKTKPRNNLFYR